MTQGRVYRDGKLTNDSVTPATLGEFAHARNTVYWLDLVGPTRGEIDAIASVLAIDSTHAEDAFKGRQRPKLEIARDYVYINLYTVAFDVETRELATEEIAAFLTDNGLITIRDNAETDLAPILRHWDDRANEHTHGVDYLVWGLLDVIVDGYFETLDKLDDQVEQLEDRIFDSVRQSTELQRLTYDLRKALVIARRLTLPVREIVGPLMRQDVVPISAEMALHFHDVYDHVMRVADWTESLRDLITTLLETNLTIQGNYMNSIMKKVTSWAAIIAVPTAITGFYGQNIPYPGFGDVAGFWWSTGAIVVISTGLYFVFKARDWL